MHEARLCLSLLSLADEHLARDGGDRILALRVEVGALSGVEPEALASAFPICAAGTAADGAELRLERTPGRSLVLRDMEVV
ncbi:MAG: hydrogenase maturation nickel metallochaperone HypA [Myxococcota bacterium]